MVVTHSPIGLTRTFVPVSLLIGVGFLHTHFALYLNNGNLTLFNQNFHPAPVFQQTFYLLLHLRGYYWGHHRSLHSLSFSVVS